MSKSAEKPGEDVVAQLQARAAASNAKLADTLQQFMYQVQPQTKLDQLKAQVKYRLEEARYKVVTTVDAAFEGDREAQVLLLKAAGLGTGVVTLLVLRRQIGKRRHR